MPKVHKPIKSRSYVIISPDSKKEELQNLNTFLVEELYKKFGAILFRGFNFNVNIFSQFTSTYCSHSMKNLSVGREIVDKINNIQSVDPGDNVFPLHPEMSREPWKPDVAFFACEIPPKQGGETLFCDGVELVRRMPSQVLKVFNKRKLRYTLQTNAEFIKYWLKKDTYTTVDLKTPPSDCPFEFIQQGDKIFRSYVTPVLHRPMFINKLAFGNFLLFARYIHNDKWFPTYEDGTIVPDDLIEAVKKSGEKITVINKWQKDDILMIDNTRFLHGRNRILNLKNRRILTYFGYLKYACNKYDPVNNAPWRNPGWLGDQKNAE